MTLDLTRPVPIPAVLAQMARDRPDDVFLVDDDGSLTYGEFWLTARRVAGGLRELGVRRNSKVALVMDNSREFLLAWFGAALLGAAEVPLNPGSFPSRLSHGIRHSKSATVVVDADHYVALSGYLKDIEDLHAVITVGAVAAGGTQDFASLMGCAPADPVDLEARDTAAILYTSGSTGLPKGAIVPHGQHFTNGAQAVRAAEITGADTVFVCLPLHHNMAQGYGVCPAILAGAKIRLTKAFSRATFWDEIDRAGATVLPFVGAMLALLTTQGRQTRVSTLRVAFGIPVSKKLHQEFESRFGITLLHGYGSTEATIVAWGPLRGERALGSSGQVIPEFDVELHDESDRVVSAGNIGEICIRPKVPYSMFQGYHDDDRTRTAFRNLWFHSGDRARFDDAGNLWFVGRTDDVIRRFGEFISAPEVEEALARHPGVELVAAYGVPSEVAGQEVMVSIVVRDGVTVQAEELAQWVSQELPRFARPRYFDLVSALPMTATGKVEKHKLRARGPGPETFDSRIERT